MTVSVTVMAHDRRRHFAVPLAADLDDANIVWDHFNDRWDTGRRAWLDYSPAASHHAVIQDDAVVPPDLLEGLCEAVKHIPRDSLMCLYAGRTRAFRGAVATGVRRARKMPSWLRSDQLMWGVGVVTPTHLVRDMIAWCDRQTHLSNYDTRISYWAQEHDIPVYYPWPSLVNHRVSPSLIPGRGYRGRVAHQFIGQNRSALSMDFTGPVAELTGIKRLAVR